MNREELGQQIAGAVETVIVRGSDLVPFVKPDRVEIVKRVNELSGHALHLQTPADFFDERFRPLHS
jgi:hypothetical protein